MKSRLRHNMLVPYIASLFMILSLFLQPFSEFLVGYKNILISESILLTDYVVIGGIGPALFNSGSLMLLCYILVRIIDMKMTGSIFAGILTIGGFALFGKNLLNVSIIFIGVLLYSKHKDIKLETVIVVFLFATGISPISSIVIFGIGFSPFVGWSLGILLGVLSGFLLVELSSHVISFHKGYNLYNIGFASGILSFFYFSLFKLAGLEYETNLLYTNSHHILLLVLFVVLCIIFIVTGWILNDYSLKGYKSILSKSGRAVTDFTRKNGEAITMLNIGFTGLLALAIIQIFGLQINGPTMGGLLTIFGFSAFGKHIKNIYPPMVGVILMVLILDLDITIAVTLAILFSTALAPVSGEFGVPFGILAGMVHLPIVLGISQIHGGVLLYANGFAAAFSAIIIDTIILSLKRRENQWHFTRK
jgi:hypothetical protein